MLSFLNGPNDGFKNLHVAGAATKISRQPVANFRLSRSWISFKQIDCRQHHAGCAYAALRAPTIDEGLLNGVQLIACGNAFDGFDRRAFDLCNWNQTTVYDAAIDDDAARAALAFATTFLRSGQLQLLAQHVQ